MSSSSSLCFSIFTTNNSINTTARSSSSRSKLFGVSPSSCPRRKKEPPQLFHFVDAECRRRLVKNSSHRQHLLYKEDNKEEEEGKPVDFYDEIIARNDALVDIMLEKIRRRESNSSNYNGDSLHREESGKNEETKVYLVGCGPGDPGLLTLKAYHLIVTADVILYDRLVSPEILEYAASARTNNNDTKNNNEEKGLMLFVGKRSGFHTRTQDEIHDLILEFANAGATVVRLKGGDPLVFGRGGEECEFLREKGFDVKVIPGFLKQKTAYEI